MNRALQSLCSILLVVLPSVAAAGVFGSSNYEDCIVDRMKGQDRSMRGAVEDSCELAFPREIELNFSNLRDFLDWTWKQPDAGSVEVELTRNKLAYKVIRIEVLLFEGACDSVPKAGAGTAHAELTPALFGSSFNGKLSSPGRYQCTVAKFFGKRYR